MRKVLLSLVAISAIAIPAFAGKFNKVVSVGDKAPTFSGLPADLQRRGHQPQPLRHQGRRGRPRLPGQPLPGRQGVRRPPDRLHQRLQGQGRPGRRRSPSPRMEQDKLPGIKDYMKDKKSNYIYGYDETQAVGKAYGATNTPQFFVLDKERKIRYTGAMDDSQAREQGQQDLPPRRGRRRAQGRDARGRTRPRPTAAASRYKKK